MTCSFRRISPHDTVKNMKRKEEQEDVRYFIPKCVTSEWEDLGRLAKATRKHLFPFLSPLDMDGLKLRGQEEALKRLMLFMHCKSKGLQGILKEMWHIHQLLVNK